MYKKKEVGWWRRFEENPGDDLGAEECEVGVRSLLSSRKEEKTLWADGEPGRGGEIKNNPK